MREIDHRKANGHRAQQIEIVSVQLQFDASKDNKIKGHGIRRVFMYIPTHYFRIR